MKKNRRLQLFSPFCWNYNYNDFRVFRQQQYVVVNPEDKGEKARARKAADAARKVNEKAINSLSSIPDDLVFFLRLLAMLRGLSSQLGVDAPILYILGLHAKVGLAKRPD